ncbi:CPCC family cysteine-rich protein [Chitinivorax sp. B]|uniref:CPCC family cysteine-rich protein n=1 Tax=Chitinivorax sp. B TaxID=2502235 RepID=UPI0010F848C3|nr:CPCC family cysteine-rich protein [Chitinivorax sp. B]
MIIANRIACVQIICKAKLTELALEERESTLLNWWGISSDEKGYDLLPEALKSELACSDDSPSDCEPDKYDPLIMLALMSQYRGVTNSHINNELNALEGEDVCVTGDVEVLEVCPCCSFRTLTSHGEYEICPLCKWEDDGTQNMKVFSGVNRKTLQQARDEFALSEVGYLKEKWIKL